MVSQTEIYKFSLLAKEDSISVSNKEEPQFKMDQVPLDYELVDNRGLYSKTFKRIDGTYEVSIYDDVIHYQKDGNFEEINNSLYYDKSTNDYENKLNAYKLKLPKTIHENKKFKLAFGDYQLDWMIKGINTSDIQVIEGEEIESNNLRIVENLNQKVVYPSILPEIDLEYILKGNSVKENFILQEYVENINVEIEINTKELFLNQNEMGIYFTNEFGDVIFDLGNFYMFDSLSNESDLIDIKIEQRKKDVYTLTIIPNDDWLKNANYPVVVDPTFLITSTGYENPIRDKYVIEGVDSSYDVDSLKIGTNYNTVYQSVFEINLDKVIEKDTITFATLELDVYGTSNTCTSCNVNIYEVLDENHYDHITGISSIGTINEVLDYAVVDRSLGEITYNFDVTKTVQQWKDSNQSKGVLLLKRDREVSGEYVFFDSSEGSGKKPTLRVGFLDDVGLNDYHTYQNQSVSAYDVVFTNDYTGELTFNHLDYAPNRNGFTFSISHFFNNDNRHVNIGYGDGFRINYNDFIEGNTLHRGDGSKVDFTSSNFCKTGLSSCLLAEDGSKDTLTKSLGTYPFYYATVETKDGIKKDYFLNSSTLEKKVVYTEKETNKSFTVFFIYGTDRIDYIVDSYGNKAQFVYVNNLLSNLDIFINDDFNEQRLIERINYHYNGTKLSKFEHTTYNYKYRYNKQEYNPNHSYTWNLNTYDSGSSYFANSILRSKTLYYVNGKYQDYDQSNSTKKRVYDLSTMESNYAYDKYEYYDKVCFKKYERDTNIFKSDKYIGTYCYYFDEDFGTSNAGGAYHGKSYYYSASGYGSTFYYTNTNGSKGNSLTLLSGISSLKSKSMVGDGDYYYNFESKQDHAVMKYYSGNNNYGWSTSSQSDKIDGDYWVDYYTKSVNWTDVYSVNQYSSTRHKSTYSGYYKTWKGAWENTGYTYSEEDLLSTNDVEWVKTATVASTNITSNVSVINYNSDGQLWKLRNDLTRNGTEVFSNPDKAYTKEDGLEYLYSGDRVTTVRQYIIDNTDTTKFTNKVSIRYGFRKSIFTDLRGNRVVYNFDQYGHTLNVMDSEGNVIYYKYSNIFEQVEGDSNNLNYKMNNKIISVSKPQKYLLNNDDYINQESNLIQNHSFEDGLVDWTTNSDFSIRTTETDEDQVIKNIIGNKSLSVVGDQKTSKEIFQQIDLTGKPGESFVLGAFLKGNIPNNHYEKVAKISVVFHIDQSYYPDFPFGTEAFSLVLDSKDDNWNYDMKEFTPHYHFTGLTLVVEYKNANEVTIDNIQLFKRNLGTNYKYNTDGNVSEISKEGQAPVTFEYDAYNPNNIKAITSQNGVETEYVYDESSQLVAVISNNVRSSFTYDAFGNVTDVTMGNHVEGNAFYKWFTTSTEYVASGQFASKTTDEYGNTVSVDYNILSGLLNSITDQTGVITDYEYDDLGNLIEVSKVNSNQSYIYENGLLVKINVNGFEYEFLYDAFGNVKEVKVASKSLMSYEYEDPFLHEGELYYPNRLESQTYSNGLTIGFTYFSNPTTGTQSFEYDASGRLNKITDDDGNTINYQYDHTTGNLVQYGYMFENFNRMINYSYYTTGDLQGYYDQTEYQTNNQTIIKDYRYFSSDSLKRLDEIELYVQGFRSNIRIYSQSIGYDNDSVETGNASTRIKTITYDFGEQDQYTYSYDEKGNITHLMIKRYSSSTMTYELYEEYYYQYDELNQLIREDVNINGSGYTNDFTYVYAYDQHGNMDYKKQYSYQPTTPTEQLTGTPLIIDYGYDTSWKDVLKQYKNQSFEYDGMGNPTLIKQDEANKIVLEWEGRQLKSYTEYVNDQISQVVSYRYNDQGIRTYKKVLKNSSNYDEYYYFLDGDRVLSEKVINVENGVARTNKIVYTYDIDGTIISFNYNGTEYFYVRNIQGDITKIVDINGNLIVEYFYDAWGNVLNQEQLNDNLIAKINPYRYRGYRYDDETSLYYLNSRYYNPEIGRFINADGLLGEQGDILGHNLYAYTQNNPVNYVDYNGESPMAILNHVIDFLKIALVSMGQEFNNLSTMFYDFSASVNSTQPYLGGGVYREIPNGLSNAHKFRANKFKVYAGMSRGLGKALKVAGTGLLLADMGFSAYNNFTNEDLSLSRQITDTVVDVGISLGTVWAAGATGAYFGNLIPIPGVGALIGFGVGVGIWAACEYTPIDEYAKDGLDWAVNGIKGLF